MDVFAKEKLNKKKIDELFDGTTVYLVDGKWVRDHCGPEAIDFMYGGHGYVYKFIPKSEIWIERMLHPNEQALWVVHECFEWLQMKYMHKPYESSHEKADTVEHIVRLMLNTSMSNLRAVLAQVKSRPGMNSNITNKMPSIAPKVEPTPYPTKHPIAPMSGWPIKEITGERGHFYARMLESAHDKQSLDDIIIALGVKYDRMASSLESEPKVEIPYQGKQGASRPPYFVTWDTSSGVVGFYLLERYGSEFYRSATDNLRRVLQAKEDARKDTKPAKVTEIADAIRRDNPDYSDEKAYRMAWETYCSYVNPGYDGCTSKGKSHRESPKSEYSDEKK